MRRLTAFLGNATSVALLLLTSNIVFSASDDDDWPVWGGPNHNFTVTPGVLKAGQPIELKVAWKKNLGSGYSAVSVRDEMAVTMFSDSTFDYAVALSINDGSELWRFKIDSTFPGRSGSANGPLSTPLLSEDKVVGLSGQGRLFVLDRESGELEWDTDLLADHQSKMPFFGYTTSPKLYENTLLVETGGTAQNAICAFDIHSGNVLWTAGGEAVFYQSPYLLETGAGIQFVGITNGALYGLQPGTGQILWRFEHGGGGFPPSGVASGNLVPTGDKHFFLKHTGRGGMLLKIKYANETYQAEEVWQTKDIKGTLVVPVYHDGHIFGYSTRIFTCINTETGKRVWRSRSPGDGFPIVVDGHLVVATKDGRLSIAPASSDGYNEIVSLDLFDNLIWAPASFARGRLFLRSLTQIAAVDIVPTQSVVEVASNTVGIPWG